MRGSWQMTSTTVDRLSLPVTLLLLLLAGGQPSKAQEPAPADKLATAQEYFHAAQAERETFERIPAEERTSAQYLKLIRAFQRVYLTAPAYGNNTICLMAVGDLYQQMGQRWNSARYSRLAIRTYEFLVREYPGSKFRLDALLAVARIYREDLKQPQEALPQYEAFLARYPRASRAGEARKAIAELQTELNARKRELAETPASPLEPKSKPASSPVSPVRPNSEAKPTASAEVVGPPSEAMSAEAAPGPAPTIDLARLTDVRQWATTDYTRVVIDVGQEVKYGVGRVDNPPRIYVDLFDTQVAPAIGGKVFPVDNGENGLLRGVKASQHSPNVSRVVLYVRDLSDYSLFDLPNPYRLVIDVHNRQEAQAQPRAVAPPAPAATPPRPSAAGAQPKQVPTAAPQARQSQEPKEKVPAQIPKAPVATPAPVKAAAPASKEATVAAAPVSKEVPATAEPVAVAKAATGPVVEKIRAAKPTRDGTRSLTRALGLKIGRIVLDPGHGGHDTGTIAPSGLYEKDLVLDVAHRLGKLIEERLGSEVVYTRDDDAFVPLETRTALANQKQADLFLSIHANSSRNSRARGVETYYLNFTTDTAALEVAARENAVSQETISQLQGLVRKIALQEKVDESRELASHIQSALAKRQQVSDRGVKKAPFVVLIGANMPSVLAEIAFLSNPQDDKLLQTAEYRDKLAEALYRGLVGYAETLGGVKVASSAPAAIEPAPAKAP